MSADNSNPAPTPNPNPTLNPGEVAPAGVEAQSGVEPGGVEPSVLGETADRPDAEVPAAVLGTKIVRPSRVLGNLPMTGANIGTIAALGAGLVATGAVMAARRDREELAVDGPTLDEDEPTA